MIDQFLIYVRFLDMYWLHFVKTLVLARCQTRRLKHDGTTS